MPPQSAPATTADKDADNSSKWLTIKDGWGTDGWGTECDKSAKGHIVIPDGVTRIWGHGGEWWEDDDDGFGAFEGCTLITSITIPDGVTEIGPHVFRGRTSLASVTIPGSVTEIGSDVFEGCDSLHEIHVRGTPSKELKKKFGLFGEYKKIKLVQE